MEPDFARDGYVGPLPMLSAGELADVRAAVLDPLGSSLRPGPDAYVVLVQRVAESLAGCLGES